MPSPSILLLDQYRRSKQFLLEIDLTSQTASGPVFILFSIARWLKSPPWNTNPFGAFMFDSAVFPPTNFFPVPDIVLVASRASFNGARYVSPRLPFFSFFFFQRSELFSYPHPWICDFYFSGEPPLFPLFFPVTPCCNPKQDDFDPFLSRGLLWLFLIFLSHPKTSRPFFPLALFCWNPFSLFLFSLPTLLFCFLFLLWLSGFSGPGLRLFPCSDSLKRWIYCPRFR